MFRRAHEEEICMKRWWLAALSLLISAGIWDWLPAAQQGVIDAFPIASSKVDLQRLAQPGTPFNKVGRRFAILGYESGTFEAWAYPVKLFRNVELSFLTPSSTRPIASRDLVRTIEVRPAATTLTYTYQSFTIRATWVAAIDQTCGMILLQIDSSEPLTVVCGFLPILQPMWPAGIGGQYTYWDDINKYYLISEPTRQNHAFIGSPAAAGLSYTPAHMLSDVPNEFKIEISDPASVKDKFIPIFMAGGKGVRDSVKAVYRRLAGIRGRCMKMPDATMTGCWPPRSTLRRRRKKSTWLTPGVKYRSIIWWWTIPILAGGWWRDWPLPAPAAGRDSAGSSAAMHTSTVLP